MPYNKESLYVRGALALLECNLLSKPAKRPALSRSQTPYVLPSQQSRTLTDTARLDS